MKTRRERSESAYFLGADESEQTRLLAQGEVHRAETEALLDRLEIPAGGRAVDFGCGPLGALDLLSHRVGPAGRVVGLDSQPRMISFAQRSIAERGLANVKLIQADARSTGLDANYFDIAHERLVLITLTSPQDVVAEMVRVVRPGGWVITQNVDWISWTCEPVHPAWDSLLDALVKAWRTTGMDPFTGRHMPGLLRGAGLADIAIEVYAHTERAGEHNHLLLLRLIDIFRDQIVGGGFMDGPQLARRTGELEEHLSRPETFTLSPLLFLAWGRKPG